MADLPISFSSTKQAIVQNIKAEIADDILQDAVQIDALAALQTKVDENRAPRRVKTKELKAEGKTKEKQIKKVEKGLFTRKETDQLAKDFSGREENRDYLLPASSLSRLAASLGEEITPEITYDDLVAKIKQELTANGKRPDVSQVDKTFDFLIEVIDSKLQLAETQQTSFLEKLKETVQTVKTQHYETFRADIETAHHIIGAANVLVNSNRTTAESLDYLRGMINEPQSAHEKFKDYVENKKYSYQEMRAEFKLLFQYMGEQVKQGHVNPYIQLLISEIKTLQATLGVFKQSARETNAVILYLSRVIGILS